MLDTAKSCQVTIGRNLERCPRILPNIFFEAPKAQRAPSKVIAGIRDGLNSGYDPKFLSKRRRLEAAIFLTVFTDKRSTCLKRIHRTWSRVVAL